MKPSDYDGRGYDPPYGYYDGPPDLSRELAAADKIIGDLEEEIGRLTREVQAWRATFPIMHVRPGALFASTNIEAAWAEGVDDE